MNGKNLLMIAGLVMVTVFLICGCTTPEESKKTNIIFFITRKDSILPHYLQELGYTTGMVGKNHVIEAGGLYQFPDYYADPELPGIKEKIEENYKAVQEAILGNGFDYAGGLYHNNPSIIWKSGGFPCGPVCGELVSNVDFAPTILEMAGAPVSSMSFDGISFMAALEGKGMKARESLFFELGYARAVIKGKYKYYAIRYPEYAMHWTPEERAAELNRYNKGREFRGMNIVNRDPDKPFSHLEVVPGGGVAEHNSYGKKPGYFDPDQLYDLESNPDEMANLAGEEQYQEILLEMKTALKKYTEDLPGKFNLD